MARYRELYFTLFNALTDVRDDALALATRIEQIQLECEQRVLEDPAPSTEQNRTIPFELK